MRHAMCFVLSCVAVTLLQPRTALADHDMTCHPEGPIVPPLDLKASSLFGLSNLAFGVGEVLNLIAASAGGATSTSCSSAGGDIFPVVLPPDSLIAVELIAGAGQAGRYWLFEPISRLFLETHIGLSAELPSFTKPDGTPLLAQYNESGVDFPLQAGRNFETGESLSASGGQILAWPAVTLREMPTEFDLDELFPPNPARFPLYSGVAQVADVAIYTVVPEPGSWLLLLGGALTIAGYRRRSWRFADANESFFIQALWSDP